MKYCTQCGTALNDSAETCYCCGKKQNPDIIATPANSINRRTPIWPLVLAIIFLVISFVSVICSITIFLAAFVLPLSIISLIFSAIALVGAKKNEDNYGRNGVLTAARVIGTISTILSVVAVSIGIIILGTSAATTTKIKSYTNSYSSSSSSSSSYSYSYQPTIPETTQQNNQTAEEPKEKLQLVTSKVNAIKYDMVITRKNELFCWGIRYNQVGYIVSAPVGPGTKPYGIGVVARKEDGYLYVSEVSLDSWGNNIVLKETATFVPDGEIKYIIPGFIIYEKNGELRVQSYENNTGSVLYDLPVRFICNDGKNKSEITGLKYSGVYREYASGQYTYSNYVVMGSLAKYRLSFASEDGQEWFGVIGNYGSAKTDDALEIYVTPEIIDTHTKKPEYYVKYDTGDFYDYLPKRLAGHTRENDTTHLYVSDSKEDLKINLPDGYTIDDIAGITLSSDIGVGQIMLSEWSITAEKMIVIAMKDNTMYYNTNAATVKGIELAPFVEINNEAKDKSITKILMFSHEWYAIDGKNNLYSIDIK